MSVIQLKLSYFLKNPFSPFFNVHGWNYWRDDFQQKFWGAFWAPPSWAFRGHESQLSSFSQSCAILTGICSEVSKLLTVWMISEKTLSTLTEPPRDKRVTGQLTRTSAAFICLAEPKNLGTVNLFLKKGWWIFTASTNLLGEVAEPITWNWKIGKTSNRGNVSVPVLHETCFDESVNMPKITQNWTKHNKGLYPLL